jgi:hypothetical protein
MRQATDVRMRRGLAVLAVAGMSLALAGPASAIPAESGEHPFEYGTDTSAWYWNRQIDQEATTPVTLPPPVPPASQRVRLPSPQRPDTLPVGVFEAQHERMSAIKFDLAERGVTTGSDITKLVLRIEESTDENEQPSYKPETAKVQACLIMDVLSPGENEQFDDRPQYSETDCAEGTREVPAAPAAPFWTFDLTEIGQPWGQDPYGNNGVMLLGVLQGGGASETWQVNLKIPSRDNAGTPNNEYEETRGRTTLTLQYVPGDPLGTTPGSGGGGAGSAGTTGTSSGGIVPSTDLTGATGGLPASTSPTSTTPSPSPAPVTAPVAQVAPPDPRVPSYVWLLIPLGLLGLSAVRSVVLEPVGGPRPDGAIAAIRRRNEERRGGPLRMTTDPLTRAAGALAGVGRSVRRGTLVAGRRVAAATRSLGRSR